MADGYEDIIGLPHHRSKRHAPMSRQNRAAQFMPFAALTGYDAAISEAGRLTEDFRELDEDMKEVLDARLQLLAERSADMPEVTIVYFVPDERKEGGAYREITGRFRKLDGQKRKLLLDRGEEIALEDILEIRSELFEY